jgi:phosphatidate cytidylyltransferase
MAMAPWVTRIGSAAVLLPIFVGIIVAPPWVFQALVIAVSAMASWELLRMFESDRSRARRVVAVLATAGVTASFLVPGAPLPALTAAVLVLLGASLVRASVPAVAGPAAGAPRVTADATVAGLLAVLYVGWLLGHALLLRALPDGTMLILVLVGVTWAGETAAYAVGSSVGRHRLAPVISPRKTVEGAAAQLAASIVAAVLLAGWLLPAWPAWTAALAGAILGVVGQVGDLAESVMKRSVGRKDTGGIIPGHGGMLDRIDGLLFNVAAFYYFVRCTGGAA